MSQQGPQKDWQVDRRTGERYFWSDQERCWIYYPSGRRTFVNPALLPHDPSQPREIASISAAEASGSPSGSSPPGPNSAYILQGGNTKPIQPGTGFPSGTSPSGLGLYQGSTPGAQAPKQPQQDADDLASNVRNMQLANRSQFVQPAGPALAQNPQRLQTQPQRATNVHSGGSLPTGQPNRQQLAPSQQCPQPPNVSARNAGNAAGPQPSPIPNQGPVQQPPADSLSTHDVRGTPLASNNPGNAPQNPQLGPPRMVTTTQGHKVLYGQDPRSGVQVSVQLGPPDRITDPSLLQEGIRAHGRLVGTQGEQERLYPSFQKRPQPAKFFSIGKVFLVLWAEPAGQSNTTAVTSLLTADERFGEGIFCKVRRFVVVREAKGYCSALPILTYNNQGVAKPGTIKAEHTIIYTGKQTPRPENSELPRRGETGMRPGFIRVDPDDPKDKLHSMSRIHFGKVYTIEHNVKVRSMGKVNRDSMNVLLYQFRDVWLPNLVSGPPQRVERASTGSPVDEDSEEEDSSDDDGEDNAEQKAKDLQVWKSHGSQAHAAVTTRIASDPPYKRWWDTQTQEAKQEHMYAVAHSQAAATAAQKKAALAKQQTSAAANPKQAVNTQQPVTGRLSKLSTGPPPPTTRPQPAQTPGPPALKLPARAEVEQNKQTKNRTVMLGGDGKNKGDENIDDDDNDDDDDDENDDGEDDDDEDDGDDDDDEDEN